MYPISGWTHGVCSHAGQPAEPREQTSAPGSLGSRNHLSASAASSLCPSLLLLHPTFQRACGWGKNPPTPREKAAEQRPHPKEVGKKENLLVACLSCALEGMSEFPFCTRTPKLSHSQCLVQVLSPPSLPDSTHLLPGGPGLAVPLPSPLQASDSSFLARLHTLPPLRPCQQQPTSHGPHLAPFEHILPSFVPPLSLPRGLSGKYP